MLTLQEPPAKWTGGGWNGLFVGLIFTFLLGFSPSGFGQPESDPGSDSSVVMEPPPPSQSTGFPLGRFFRNFGLTILLEGPVWLAFYWKKWKWGLPFFLLMNLFTLPLGTLAVHSLKWNWEMTEILITLAEAGMIAKIWEEKWGKALLISFLANGISAGYAWVVFG